MTYRTDPKHVDVHDYVVVDEIVHVHVSRRRARLRDRDRMRARHRS